MTPQKTLKQNKIKTIKILCLNGLFVFRRIKIPTPADIIRPAKQEPMPNKPLQNKDAITTLEAQLGIKPIIALTKTAAYLLLCEN